jgi:hypothetical protein
VGDPSFLLFFQDGTARSGSQVVLIIAPNQIPVTSEEQFPEQETIWISQRNVSTHQPLQCARRKKSWQIKQNAQGRAFCLKSEYQF